MARERLTKRQAVEDNIPYSGNLNQPERKFKTQEEYHTFEQTVNHELPDMRTEWKQDSRDEIGFSVPTVASIRSAASKAVKLAVLLLGDKVSEEIIEAQARDFMKLGSESLEVALARFAESETLYVEASKAQEEDAKEEDAKEEDKEEDKEASKAQEEDAKEEDAKEEDKEASKAQEEDAKEEDAKEEDKEASKAQEEDAKEEDVVVEDKIEASTGIAELDIELTVAADDGDTLVSDEEGALLASLLDDQVETEVVVAKTTKKAGIKTLGGQPKQAAGNNSVDLSNIWGSAPDVSELF